MATTAIMAPMASPSLLHDVGALLGDDVQGLGQLVRFVRGMGAPYKSALTPFALRLWSLRAQLDPTRRVLLSDSVGVLLREVGEAKLAEEVFDEGLRLCDDPALQASLLLERGLTRLERRDDQGALQDAEAGLAIEPALVALWSLRVVCLRRVGRKAEAFELACRIVAREDIAQIGRADGDEAAKHAWELGRQLERHAELVAPLEHYCKLARRDLALWSVRRSWLHATLGEVELARELLTGSVELLRLDPQLGELAGTALVAAAALGGEERVPAALNALVNVLEPQRVGRTRGD